MANTKQDKKALGYNTPIKLIEDNLPILTKLIRDIPAKQLPYGLGVTITAGAGFIRVCVNGVKGNPFVAIQNETIIIYKTTEGFYSIHKCNA